MSLIGLPSASNDPPSESPTMADLAQRYMREFAEIKKKPNSIQSDEILWRLHVIPLIGHIPVRSISRADVMKMHSEIGQKSRVIANRARAIVSKSLNLAEVWELRPDGSNPCRHVTRFQEPSREKILTEDELERLNHVLDEIENEYWRRSWQIVPLVRLLLYTGCRLREIMHAKIDWVDWERKFLILPDSKTGARKKPLSDAALHEIRRIPRPDGNPWLIPSFVKGRPFTQPYPAWNKVCERAGITGLVIHDLRHTVGSYAHRAGLSQAQVADILGHKSLQTTARYIHTAESEFHKNENLVADIIKSRMEKKHNEK